MRDRWRTDNPPREEESYLIQLKSGNLLICKWSDKSYYGGNLFHNNEWRWINLPQYTPQEDVEAWQPLPDPFDARMTAKEVQDREVEVNGEIHKEATCPNCGVTFAQGSGLWLSYFCCNCGQKLLW